MIRRDPLPGIKPLTVRSGRYEICQALRVQDVVSGLGLGIIVTCIHGSGILDGSWDPEADGLSESWDWSDESKSGTGAGG